ncbi:hypothetical protein [uncultured Jannaschia sp.]|uniref:hypothetical protein n=1 Tax=uncultured Jannaschia sp. TaxID=293347 RepID=UPI00262CEB70|nr:hypothetical protein [uncultured Jannaschia sp.]
MRCVHAHSARFGCKHAPARGIRPIPANDGPEGARSFRPATRKDENLARAGDWYPGERSFADAYLDTLVRWLDLVPLPLGDYPALRAHRDRMETDDGVRHALARQGMTPQT